MPSATPSSLKNIENKEPIKMHHFPTPATAVIFRNWGMVPVAKLAQILKTDENTIKECAALMGLDLNKAYNPAWRKRGYATLIRNAWHLLTFEQICEMLDINQEQLDFILKEDDFMWHKLGRLKPMLQPAVWHPLNADEKAAARIIGKELAAYHLRSIPDNAFSFISDYYDSSDQPENHPCEHKCKEESIRFIYSYFALYGDPLMDREIDPFPEGLLKQYASLGINGVWLQGVLYQLVPYPFAPELSLGWEKRLEALNDLVRRAGKYGIGVYLYLNEPRSLPVERLSEFPHLRGHVNQSSGLASLCTSAKEVQEYLFNAAFELFSRVPGLAGFFTITRSENQTNCYSHTTKKTCTCPRCSLREPYEVIAEVNNLLAAGAKKANSSSRAIAWSWGWLPEQMQQALEAVDKSIIFQSTSETYKRYKICGTGGTVNDYSISIPGPGEWAKDNWKLASQSGHECCAKVQLNTTWENCNVPFIPVFELVAEHINGLKQAGVKHFMLSWTLGGAPSPTMKMVSYLLDKPNTDDSDVEKFIEEQYGEALSPVVQQAQLIFSSAFREFPFHIGVVYNSPQSSGPKSPFFPEPTNYRATMVGLPYDDLDGWRSIYPEEIFEFQFKALCDKWSYGLGLLKGWKGEKHALYDELVNVAEGCLVCFRTNYHLIRFTRIRNDMLIRKTNDRIPEIIAILEAEEHNVLDTIRLQSADSRIGFEATNQYNFCRNDLEEKLLNIAYCKRYYNNLK